MTTTWRNIAIALALVLMFVMTGCTTKPAPAPTPEAEYTETQFTVPGQEIYHFNIFANEGDTIKGYWKADNPVYRWYTTPGGVALPLDDYGDLVKGVHEPTPLEPEPQLINKDGKYSSMMGAKGGNINIEAKHPYGGAGFYTICFMPYPYDINQSVNITVRYWVD